MFTFPDPRESTRAVLTAAKPTHFPTATITTAFPSSGISAPHIQHAWDGTTSEEQQRERCLVRVTVWTPKGEVAESIRLAALAKAILLDAGTDGVWRFTPATGRLQGIDPDTGLPFCTFTLTAETRPQAVSP